MFSILLSQGGIFVDSAVHDIDMVNWLVGEEPETVYATGHASHPMWQEVGDVDTCAAVLKYPGGAVALVDVCRNAPVGYDQRVEVCSKKNTLANKSPHHPGDFHENPSTFHDISEIHRSIEGVISLMRGQFQKIHMSIDYACFTSWGDFHIHCC